jgi:hypothetical protein
MFLLPVAEMLLQYAVSDHDNYMTYGQQSGMIALDLQSGKVNEVNIHVPQCRTVSIQQFLLELSLQIAAYMSQAVCLSQLEHK